MDATGSHPRENGYYWIKYKGTDGDPDFWIVAEWSNCVGGCWDGGDLDEIDIVKINETKLIEPED